MGKSTHVHNPRRGEIWTAWYPFIGTKGGYHKKRPVLVRGYDDDGKVIVQRISTKPKFGSRPILYPTLNQKSYLHNEYASIEPMSFRHMIWKPYNDKPMMLDEMIPYPDKEVSE